MRRLHSATAANQHMLTSPKSVFDKYSECDAVLICQVFSQCPRVQCKGRGWVAVVPPDVFPVKGDCCSMPCRRPRCLLCQCTIDDYYSGRSGSSAWPPLNWSGKSYCKYEYIGLVGFALLLQYREDKDWSLAIPCMDNNCCLANTLASLSCMRQFLVWMFFTRQCR